MRAEVAAGKRLRLVVVGASLETGHFVFLAAEAREHQDRRNDILGAELPTELDTAHAWHPDIQQVQVRLDLARRFERSQPIGGGDHLKVAHLEGPGQELADSRIVFRDQNGLDPLSGSWLRRVSSTMVHFAAEPKNSPNA